MDRRRAPDEAVDRDQLLTNVTLYWLIATAGFSARLYHQADRAGTWSPQAPSAPPTGVAVFPREDRAGHPALRRAVGQHRALDRFRRGGHFAATEAPDLLVSDVREFFRRFR